MEPNLEELLQLLYREFYYKLEDIIAVAQRIDFNAHNFEGTSYCKNSFLKENITVKDTLDLITEELHYDNEEVFYAELPWKAIAEGYFKLESIKDLEHGAKHMLINKNITNLSYNVDYKFRFDKEYFTEQEIISMWMKGEIRNLETFKKLNPYRIKLTVKTKIKKEI